MSPVFEVVSWLAMIALVITSVPQIILNYKRKSTEGVSWLMFGLLLFGMGTLAIRSFFVTTDAVVRLNFNLGALITLLINIQIFYYRYLCSKKSFNN